MNTSDILTGDAQTCLAALDARSVQCVVTSPPYFGLRDYGVDGQIGLEPTPDAYVQQLVAVFREVRRVLADDGVVFLNLGDSYAGGGYSNHDVNGEAWKSAMNGDKRRSRQQDQRNALAPFGIKPKDLIGIPWAVAFALRADGWYLRSDIIWHKPNPMPESVTDRPTKAHEYLFLLTKNAKYYYDADAIKEPVVADEQTQRRKNATRNRLEGKGDREGVYHARGEAAPFSNYAPTRNKRTVWTITPQPFRGAHFATMPEKLVEPCILAGSAPGDVVLDPFAGSGTVGVVALHHGRDFIGIELNSTYVQLAEERIAAGSRKL